jgi:hypothetical protein
MAIGKKSGTDPNYQEGLIKVKASLEFYGISEGQIS